MDQQRLSTPAPELGRCAQWHRQPLPQLQSPQLQPHVVIRSVAMSLAQIACAGCRKPGRAAAALLAPGLGLPPPTRLTAAGAQRFTLLGE